MRTVKFRAWDKINKRMSISQLSEVSMDFEGLIYVCGEFRPEYQTQFEIMQFTGLKDKNSKEIYEGDILRLDNEAGMEFLVEFSQNIACFIAKDLHLKGHYTGLSDILEMEVIGNIYENPELLEEATK